MIICVLILPVCSVCPVCLVCPVCPVYWKLRVIWPAVLALPCRSSRKQTMNDLITYLLVCIGLLKRQLKRNNKYKIPPQHSKLSAIWNWVPTGELAANHCRSMLDMELSGPESRQPPLEDLGTDCELFQVTPRWHLIRPSTPTRALYCIVCKYNALIGLKIVLIYKICTIW